MQNVVVALGGNALARENEVGTIAQQFAAARETCHALADVVQAGWSLTLTHGNGPQVGNALRRVELSAEDVYKLPLGICDADTQGGIGYMLAQVLGNELRRRLLGQVPVAVVTQVEVDPQDPELQNPSKPIGRFYNAHEAQRHHDVDGWLLKEDSGRGFRRVVPSPVPVDIVELDVITSLLEDGYIPIAVGGGGIPVVREPEGQLEGLDGVIDKDRATALLANLLRVETLLICTGVPNIQVDFGTPQARALTNVRVVELHRYLATGQFPPGSMGPKVEAVIEFLERGGKRAIICDAGNLVDALNGSAGTQVFA